MYFVFFCVAPKQAKLHDRVDQKRRVLEVLDFATLEGTFCVDASSKSSARSLFKPRRKEVEVLDAKRAMHVNVYVKSLGIPVDQLVDALDAFDGSKSDRHTHASLE